MGGGGFGGLVFTEKSWRRKIMKAGQWEGMKVGEGSKHCPGEGLCSKNECVSAEKHKAERERPS